MSNDLVLALPELALFGLACLALLLGSLFRHSTAGGICIVRAYWLGQLSLGATLLLLASMLGTFSGLGATAFGGSYIYDPVSAVLKMAICLISIAVFLYSRDYFHKHGVVKGEYYILGLFAVLGMLIMVSAYNLLTVYLGLELLSLSLYAMVAMQGNTRLATEAAVKYFVLGALASGMLLYGISIVYGVTGSLALGEISAYAGIATTERPWLVYATVFIIAGLAFKLGAVPFHMWLPDVYQGAPTAVTLFIASAPKLAAFAMSLRLLADGLLPLVYDWQHILMFLAVLSIGLGNVVAIAQSNLKRMLAYSAIAHTGFILLGLSNGTAQGFAGAMFYVVIYAVMSAGVFGVLILLGRKGQVECAALDDCKGLARRRPWFAFIMLCLMFSMAGMPPLAGFWAKWFVLKELVAAGYVWVAAVAVLFSIIGAFYYLRVVKLMYFDELGPSPQTSGPNEGSVAMQWTLSFNGLLLLLLGLLPGYLMQLCVNATTV